MQESLLNTVKKLQNEQKVNVEELEVILNSDIEEVVTLCKKACLKPKTDSMGNAYFTVADVDVLKKMKELYFQAQNVQKQAYVESNMVEKAQNEKIEQQTPVKKVNFLQKAKERVKSELPTTSHSSASFMLQASMKNLENNLIEKFNTILSEKMDGFDEIIVELIRSKTENENLRQQVNNLNKQVYVLKKELASYTQLPLGFYIKKDVEQGL